MLSTSDKKSLHKKFYRLAQARLVEPSLSNVKPDWACALDRERENGEPVTGVFHATSEDYCSWYEFACEFFKIMNVKQNFIPCTTKEYPTAATRPINSILENKKLNALDINSFITWRQDLERYVNQHGEQLLIEFKS